MMFVLLSIIAFAGQDSAAGTFTVKLDNVVKLTVDPNVLNFDANSLLGCFGARGGIVEFAPDELLQDSPSVKEFIVRSEGLGKNVARIGAGNSDYLYLRGAIRRSYVENFTLYDYNTHTVPPIEPDFQKGELIFRSASQTDSAPKFLLDGSGNLSAMNYILKTTGGQWPVYFTKDQYASYGFDERRYEVGTVFPWISLKAGGITQVVVNGNSSQCYFEVRNTTICNHGGETTLYSSVGSVTGETGFHAIDTVTNEVRGGLNVVVYRQPDPIPLLIVQVGDPAYGGMSTCSAIVASSIQTYLNSKYSPCVVQFAVTKHPNIVVSPYNLDKDSYFDMQPYNDPYRNPTSPTPNTETQTVINSCASAIGDLDSYKYVIFVVPYMHRLLSNGTYIFPQGSTYMESKYGFVICNSTGDGLKHTIAHELGHMLGGLPDLYHSVDSNRNYQLDIDDDNLMNSISGTVLRKDQWDMINTNAIDRMDS
jgi:hypothetical protein